MQFSAGEINIICTNLEASLKFYRDVLGFVPMRDDEGYYHMLCGERQYLLLPIAKHTFSETSYGAIAQISMDLHVDDLAQAYQYCQSHAVEFVSDWHIGADMFVICDPDGLHWEIIA